MFCLSSISRVYWSRDWLIFARLDPDDGIYEEITRLKLDGKDRAQWSRNGDGNGENRSDGRKT